MTQKEDAGHGNDILDLLREFDLFAVDTLFKSERKKWGGKYRYCNATYMPKDETKRPRKLAYTCVSNRWKSMVLNTSVKWGPSFHRFDHQKFDHKCLSSIALGLESEGSPFDMPPHQLNNTLRSTFEPICQQLAYGAFVGAFVGA